MRTWPVGTKIYVCGNRNHHNYTIGKPYIITEIDDDGTFKARDPETGVIGNWLRWEDVDTTPPIGWEFARTVLPNDVIDFLSAFDGIENIVLRDELKNRLLRRIPNLYDAILSEHRRARAPVGGKPVTLAAFRSIAGEGTSDSEPRAAAADEDAVISEEEARRLLEETLPSEGDPPPVSSDEDEDGEPGRDPRKPRG